MGSMQRQLFRIALCSTLACAADSEWPRFRGPDANPAVAAGRLPEKWSTTENVEWVTGIPGRGWSSPIVSGNRIFLTTVTTEGKSKPPQIGTEYSNQYAAELVKKGLSEKEVLERVVARDIELPKEVTLHYFIYCLDLNTGKVNWKQEFHSGQPPGGRHRKNSFASETPVTDGNLVYVYIGNLGLYAYDMKGAQVWHTPLEAHPIYLDFGTAASAALWNDMLVIVNDNEKQQFIAAFNKKTGKQLWRTERNLSAKGGGPQQRSGWVSPFIWKNPQRTEIVTIGPGTAVSYDLEGKELWRVSGMAPTPIPSPFAHEGLLHLNGGKGRPLFAIKPGASGDITPADESKPGEFIAWMQPRSGTYLATEVAYQGAIYVLSDNGILSRFDAKTGKLTYRSRIEGGEAFTSSPWAYNGKIFCLNEEGKTFVISAGEKYQLLDVNPLGEMALATPAIVGNRLILRTETRLYSLRNKK
jgi:outer membrane protein assembly factor BamB